MWWMMSWRENIQKMLFAIRVKPFYFFQYWFGYLMFAQWIGCGWNCVLPYISVMIVLRSTMYVN